MIGLRNASSCSQTALRSSRESVFGSGFWNRAVSSRVLPIPARAAHCGSDPVDQPDPLKEVCRRASCSAFHSTLHVKEASSPRVAASNATSTPCTALSYSSACSGVPNTFSSKSECAGVASSVQSSQPLSEGELAMDEPEEDMVCVLKRARERFVRRRV